MVMIGSTFYYKTLILFFWQNSSETIFEDEKYSFMVIIVSQVIECKGLWELLFHVLQSHELLSQEKIPVTLKPPLLQVNLHLSIMLPSGNNGRVRREQPTAAFNILKRLWMCYPP